jgi:hypothetical protein
MMNAYNPSGFDARLMMQTANWSVKSITAFSESSWAVIMFEGFEWSKSMIMDTL